MTTYARIVLADCKAALDDLEDGIQGWQWKSRWITAVALLRTVGYTLKAVDAQTSDKMAAAVDAEWQALNQTKAQRIPTIFWEFIDKERHNILHEYRFGAGQGVAVPVGVIFFDSRTGETRSSPPTQPIIYSYPITTGIYAGRDQRELIAEAIQWWEKYLDRVDARV